MNYINNKILKKALIYSFILCPIIARCEVIAFFYALPADWAALQKAGAMVRKSERIGAVQIQSAILDGHEIVAAQLGVGQAESAVVAAGLLARHPVDRVLSTGAVGGIGERLAIGDCVVINQIHGWQAGTEGAGGWRESERAIMRPALWPEEWKGPPATWPKVCSASAEIFVAAHAERSRLRSLTSAQVVDMNLYGLQKAIDSHQLRALHLRVISDLADEDAGANFGGFVSTYDGQLGKTAADLIRSLGHDPESPDSHPNLRALRAE